MLRTNYEKLSALANHLTGNLLAGVLNLYPKSPSKLKVWIINLEF